jgi:uncharacterized membrane protein YiaA
LTTDGQKELCINFNVTRARFERIERNVFFIKSKHKMGRSNSQTTSGAFIAASWIALGTGMVGYMIGLWRSEMLLNEKGYYFTVLMYGLFAAVSVQKSVRDRLEGIMVTNLYYGISWFSTTLSMVLLAVGLWNAALLPSEKGFYAFAFLLSAFGAIAVQKNTRDTQNDESGQ